MKKIAIFSMLFVITFALTSCDSAKNKARLKIQQLEQDMLDAQTFMIDDEKAAELNLALMDYIKEYPEDTICADYLFKLAEISSGLGRYGDAVNHLDNLIENYSAWKKLPDALFLKGFILEDKMMNLSKAKKAYQELIDRFPDHPFSENAKVIIENLGIPSDSLIKRFEEQNSLVEKL
jgi:tetratricopeptide (TPR) repeat protein